MSAIAILKKSDEIQLLSDGLETRFDSSEVLSTETTKIYKINDSIAVLILGSYGEVVESMVTAMSQHPGHPDPYDIAEAVGAGFQAYFSMHDIGQPRDFLCFIVGYTCQGVPELWKLSYYTPRAAQYGFVGSNPHTPIKETFEADSVISIATGVPETDFKQRLTDKDPETAFVEMIQDLQLKGLDVGGRIFTETLTPYEFEMVSMTDLNEFMNK